MELTSFDQCWNEICSRLTPMPKMCSWSVAGRAKGEFGILEVTRDSVTVETGNRPREVPRESFEVIFEKWADYKTGTMPRKALTEISYNSTYVISILHWLELQAKSS